LERTIDADMVNFPDGKADGHCGQVEIHCCEYPRDVDGQASI
jgi:hypothetical protein